MADAPEANASSPVRPSGDGEPSRSWRRCVATAHRALCHRRTDQWRKLPRLCRAGPSPGPRARRHCRHGQPRSHKGRAVRAAIRWPKPSSCSLPAYSPDLNPIEQAFAKIKPCCARPTPEPSNRPGEPSARCSTASPRQNVQLLHQRRICFGLSRSRSSPRLRNLSRESSAAERKRQPQLACGPSAPSSSE